MSVVFCKYSNERANKFQIKTTIVEKGNVLKVYKSAVSQEGKKHIEQMVQHYEALTKLFTGSECKANKCRIDGEHIEFEYLNGKTLEECLDELYKKKDYLGVIDKLKEYVNVISSFAKEKFIVTKSFVEVFGECDLPKMTKSCVVSNIDLIPSNIVINDYWNVIDYEWTFNFLIPIDYIIYRGLYYYIHGTTRREKLIEYNIFELFGITEEERKVYKKMETHFQSYVLGNQDEIRGYKNNILKPAINVVNSVNNKEGTEYVQLYFDKGNGYNECDTLKIEYNLNESNKIKIQHFINGEFVKKIRIDPANSYVIVKINELFWKELDYKNIDYCSNGKEIEEKILLFDTMDPNIEIVVPKNKNLTLGIDLEIYLLDEFLGMQYIKLNNKYHKCLQENANKDNIITEKDAIIANRDNIIYENSLYIQKIHSMKAWKILAYTKKGIKSLKDSGMKQTLKRAAGKIKGKKAQIKIKKSSIKMKEFKQRENSKEKVLLIVHEAQQGGATLLSMSILKTIKRITNYEPIVVLMSGGPLVEEFQKEAKVFCLDNNGFAKLDNENLLVEIVRQLEDDGVKYALCNSVVTGLTLKVLKSFGIKTITMVHELFTSIQIYDFMNASKAVSRYSDYIVFAAEFVKKSFCDNFKPEEKKCFVIPQGIYSKIKKCEIEEKKLYKQKLCKKLGISEHSKIVLGCGYGNFRKGLDLFGQVAVKTMLSFPEYHFIWLGNCDSEFFNWINNDLKATGLENRFHWIEFLKNPSSIFLGSDAFLLTSREDPFPSVVMEAMSQYTVVIAFENAGGIPEILDEQCGIVVPYCDCEAMRTALVDTLNNKRLLNEIIVNAKKKIENNTPEKYVEQLMDIVTNHNYARKQLSYGYKVSVVIPNYNYEMYISERLETILNQTYKPYEVIFLDDCSSDNSVKIAESLLEKAGIKYKIIANKINNGCFRQWIKGIEAASGDLIWIAEADDRCQETFLEELVGFFEDEQVNLAYSQSEVIYEQGEHSGFIYTEYTKVLSESKWNENYVNNGEAEIIDGLGIMNTIPNASGTLLRKSALKGLEEQLREYSISGDWFTYVYAISKGKIAFCSKVLNFHRRHKNSIIHRQERDIQMFIELMNIKLFIAKTFMIPESIKEKFLKHIQIEYDRLFIGEQKFYEHKILADKQNELERIVNHKISEYLFLQNASKKNLLFVAPDYEMGGGQTLIVRLANYFSRFHNVFVYNARPWLEEARIKNMFVEKVKILESNGTPKQLNAYIKKFHIDTINDHIWWSDKIVYQAVKDTEVNVVLSMHGCYEALLEHPDWDADFMLMASEVLKRANHIIYATDKNKKIFDVVPVIEKAKKIHYGYEVESIPKKSKESIGATRDSFIFGLVARGIKEKGFEEAIIAFNKIQNEIKKEAHLILIGNGNFIEQLKEKYNNKNIHFIDNLKKPSEWIGWVKMLDVGLLPSYFISESLPNTIIEYLAYDLPVISTNIGDIKYMLRKEDIEAGVVLELNNMHINIDALAESMKNMVNDEMLLEKYRKGAHEMFKQFDMKNFANNYYKFY